MVVDRYNFLVICFSFLNFLYTVIRIWKIKTDILYKLLLSLAIK